MKTEYVTLGMDFNSKKAVIYTDQLRDDGTIFYGPVKNFRPYFYVPENSLIPFDDSRITGSEPGHVSIFGEKLIRVYTRLPNDVPQVRDMFAKHYEADILFPWRYRIDRGYVNKENVRFFVDIEVSMGTRFLKGSFTHPIICLTCYDTKNKVYHTFVWRGDLKRTEENLIIKERIAEKKNEHKDMNVILHKFSNEKEMLNAFCMYFVGVNPDVVTSWNTSFDYPYLINRMYALQMQPQLLSPIKNVGVDKFDGEAIIKGRYVLDLLQAYKKLHIGQLESFKLDDVGMFEFEVPKIKFTETFEELWKQKLQILIEYNIADLEICVKLDEKKKILDFFEGVATFTGVPLDETLANSRVLDFYFLKEAYKRNIHMPSADKNALPPEFEGAIVKEPIKGLHKNVICLDLTSLYPSIILAGNMSLETIDPNGDIKFGNGVSFKSKPMGFIPSLIQDFLDRRKKIKKEMLDEFEKNGKTSKYLMLDDQQNVTKFLTNCFSDDTEVLTPSGIKNIKDFKVGDEVYSVNPDTLRTEVKKVTKTFKYRYKDDMYHIHSSDSDFIVTPNHRMFMGGGNAGNKSLKYRFVNAENLFDNYADNMYAPFKGVDDGCIDEYITLDRWLNDDSIIGIKPSMHGHKFKYILRKDGVVLNLKMNGNYNKAFSGSTIYTIKFKDVKDKIDYLYKLGCDIFVKTGHLQKFIPFRYNTSDWFELAGYFISEGNTYCSNRKEYDNGNVRGVTKYFAITQKNVRCGVIEDLLDRMGMRYNKQINKRNNVACIEVTGELLYNIFRSEYGTGSYSKTVPLWMFKYYDWYLRILLNALFFGDGSADGYVYSTVSKELAERVQMICLHLGRNSKIVFEKYSSIYRVYCKKKKKSGHVIGSKQGINNVYNKIRYDGYVYCIEVEDNHTLYAGRNGKFQAVANSIYGILGFFRSRYFLLDVAKTITWVGREINLHTQRIVEKHGYTVITGDTDSVYVKLPEDYSLEKMIEVGKVLQDDINESYTEFSNQFGISNMKFDIKFEKIYSVMIACKKKRYLGLLIWKEGKTHNVAKHGQLVDIVGFETRRSDTSRFSKEFLKVLYKMLLNETPRKEVYKFILDKMEEYKKAPLDDIASPRSFTKKFGDYLGSSANSVFIRSAEWANTNLGYDFGEGSKCLFLYAKNTPTGGVCYMRGDEDKLEANGIKVDYEMMVGRGILMKLVTVFEALEYSIDEMKSGYSQAKLDQWF